MALPVCAVEDRAPFADPQLEARYQHLIRETRCLVCQNQTIADSNAGLAGDLRRQIKEQIANGASDSEIIDYLVSRYGDFVLYRPPVKSTTWLLWAGPALLVLIGMLVFGRVIYVRSRQPLDEDPARHG
jgi:cytochrome c-type biogenesis protein CcmH